MLRKLPVLADLPRTTVTYCQYGDAAQKPTDIWGRLPATLHFHPPCGPGDPCHEPAPRGTRTGGTQGKATSALRAEVPFALSMAVCIAVENYLTQETTT